MTVTTTPPIRILIADDHRLIRHGLAAICRTKGGFTIVGEAEDGRQAVDLARRLMPDLIVMDIQMPKLDGIAAMREILTANPAARVLMLTMHSDDANLFAAIQAGAKGYFLKDGDADDLVAGLRAVHRGEALMDPSIAARVMEAFRRLSTAVAGTEQDLESLTPGEMDVLLLVARGADNAEIAARLGLSVGTVGNRLSAIYDKLRVNNRTQAALEALRRGWASLDEG